MDKPDGRSDPMLEVSLLASYDGAIPPAPRWFHQAIAQAPARTITTVDGCDIETLTWGRLGNPGLMLLHGNGAHADWWTFLAPLLAAEFRVAAISLSGMGASGWRERYSPATHAREALVAAETAGIFQSSERPIFVAHSFGGVALLYLAAQFGARLKAAILIDTVIDLPDASLAPPPRTRPSVVYPTLAAALARFRFSPAQPCGNPFIVDHIARASLRPVEAPEGAWTWRFDPFATTKYEWPNDENYLSAARCPVAMLWGERSSLFRGRSRSRMFALLPVNAPKIAIPDSDHHVLADQPLALVASMRALLATWPPRQ